jgi:hypothetical protein
LGYVVEHGEEMVSHKAQPLAEALAEQARRAAPQEPTYDRDLMLCRLLREALFHRDSERRHLAALLISASPFAVGTADALLSLMGEEGFPVWVRSRAATLVRYLGEDVHRMRMLGFVDHPVEDLAASIAQGLGHLTYTPLSDQALRSSLGAEWSPRERAKMYALGMTGSPGLRAMTRASGVPDWQRSAARWWISQGPAIRA